jgi:hypothetical protein
MAKKKQPINLKKLQLSFEEKGVLYKLLEFKPSSMTIDVQRYENSILIDTFNIPFAHLPKKLKKIIKSNEKD